MSSTSWTNFFAYQPQYAADFMTKIDQILQSRGQDISEPDISHLDLIHPGLHEGIDAFFRDHSIAPGSLLFEVGTGLGGTSRHIASTYACRVDGIDYLGHLVEASTHATRKLSIDHLVSHSQGDISAIDLPESHYDHSLAIGVFMYIPQNDGFARLFRALKPGGLFYYEDYYFVRSRASFSEEEAEYVDARGMIGVRSKEETVGALKEAGFVVVEDSEFGAQWSEAVWSRSEKLLREHREGQIVLTEGHFYQYVQVSPQLCCDLSHMSFGRVKELYPNLCQLLDAEHIIYQRPRITSVHRLVLMKPIAVNP